MKTTLSVAIATILLIAGFTTMTQLSAPTEAQDTPPVEVKKQEIKTATLGYNDGDTDCEGFYAYDTSIEGKRPVVLVIHDWMGRGNFDEDKSRELAKLGYLAFSIDVYGKDVRPKDASEAGKAAGGWKGDIKALRTRLRAGLLAAQHIPQADKTKISAIGFCFGGTCALELARSGADVDGVISFHGGLGTSTPDDASNIKGKVLVLHGAADPFANMEEVIALNSEMEDAKVDYEIVLYGHAVHAFTNPKAGDDPKRGAAYHEQADTRSWVRMQYFFNEIFE